MAKLPGAGLKKMFANIDAKSRIFLLFAAVVGISLLVYIGGHFLGGGATSIGPTKVAGAPKGLVAAPGSELTPQYYRALEQANAQSAAQATITRGTAVPTLVNVPGQDNQQNCTVLCPSEDNANVADDINSLVNASKLSKEDANRLLDLASKNVSVDEYAAALAALVKAGKLTPEQARLLLDKYKKQHANSMMNESARLMDGLIKSNQLPLDVANELLDAQKRKLTPAEYAAMLDRMVKAGLISPETAAQLLAQYTQQYAKEAAKKGSFAIDKMAKSGEITGDVANILKDLQSKNVPLSQYSSMLDRLVAEGKMTPAAAAKLLALYRAQRTSNGALSDLMAKGGASADLAKRLADLQANNASANDYINELKRAVQAGLITPEEAQRLLDQYLASLANVIIPGTEPGVERNIPGTNAFDQLTQRVQSKAAVTPVTKPEFTEVVTQVHTETSQERYQRLQLIQTAMAAQAQNILTAWTPPVMTHREGTPPTSEKGTTVTTTSTMAKNPLTGGAAAAELKPVLIKAGTILFAVLDTAVDSDYPDTPVMATIVEGPYKNAKLLGKLSLAQGKDKVSLNFNLMDTNAWVSAKSISAFAIDPDTARTVMASEVNHHYLTRYGAIMATSFLSGYSSAITQEGTSTTGIFGTSSSHPSLSPGNKLAVGLGQIGTNLTGILAPNVNMPATVKVKSGVGLGILFATEVTE